MLVTFDFKLIFTVLGVQAEKCDKFAKTEKAERGEVGEDEDDAPPQLVPEEGPGPEEIMQMEQMEKVSNVLTFFSVFFSSGSSFCLPFIRNFDRRVYQTCLFDGVRIFFNSCIQ